MTISTILQHRHSLSIDVTSLEELNMIAAQLERIGEPVSGIQSARASCFSRSTMDGESYWLCYYYDGIPLELLYVLASLRTRYTLHDTVTHQDTLRFWPDYLIPEGVLASLILSPTS